MNAQDLTNVNMESVRHTGATVIGLSIVDRKLIEDKKAAGELTKVWQSLVPQVLVETNFNSHGY